MKLVKGERRKAGYIFIHVFTRCWPAFIQIIIQQLSAIENTMYLYFADCSERNLESETCLRAPKFKRNTIPLRCDYGNTRILSVMM